jgi:Domain of unknown function (DUF4260)
MHAVHSPMSRTAAKRCAYAALTALLLAGAIAAIVRDGAGVWQLFAFAAAPDLALLLGIAPGLEKGRLLPRAVPFYNAAHSLWGPALLAVASIALPAGWLVAALAWALHIALDRSVGYGMRTRDGFQRS